LEAVVATLDPRQKIEMLKSRAAHVRQPDWKKAIKAHADRLERVAKATSSAWPRSSPGELGPRHIRPPEGGKDPAPFPASYRLRVCSPPPNALSPSAIVALHGRWCKVHYLDDNPVQLMIERRVKQDEFTDARTRIFPFAFFDWHEFGPLIFPPATTSTADH
jgi:hypothetical protein